MAQREEKEERIEAEEEKQEEKQEEENEMKIDHDILLSFEEPDEELEKLPLAFTPKRPRSSSHSSPYNRTQFYNSRPQYCATPMAPSEFTLQSRPMRVFTVPIPQREPTKKKT